MKNLEQKTSVQSDGIGLWQVLSLLAAASIASTVLAHPCAAVIARIFNVH